MNEIPWNMYPRPAMRRDSFLNLNGEWDLTIVDGAYEEPHIILVPYPPESELSMLSRRIHPEEELIYRKRFTLPDGFLRDPSDRVLLHFGAVDQSCKVTLNDSPVGAHSGGYSHFSFEVGASLNYGEENELVVRVRDKLDQAPWPRGKQKEKNGGMWYTPVSGIWQTVWMEAVPERYIGGLEVTTEGNLVTVKVEKAGRSEEGLVPMTPVVEFGRERYRASDGSVTFEVPDPEYWTPENPKLYDFAVRMGDDRVESYFALRSVSVKTVRGIPRLCLNGEPYFFHGVLDQGYWPDGIFLPEDPKVYTRDLKLLKDCGFNMLRKHIKVEPDLFYYCCDRIGIAVFQDMVQNGRYSFFTDTLLPGGLGILKHANDEKKHKDPVMRAAFRKGMRETVEQLKNFPCVVYWTIFNEGWGQFDGSALYEELREMDPTRIIDTASGWFGGKESDVESDHIYFGKIKPPKERTRPWVLSEYGGYIWREEGHLYNPDKTYGYRNFKSREAFEEALLGLMEHSVLENIPEGLCADVYTQLSDVEEELNGLVTYDRVITKVSREKMKRLFSPERIREMFEKTTPR
ncbi:MAG: glycoside hydrolase family 2 [Lachnospiraceae bacterium]|nr:glycoside hydrolase family 2 [Lachnospiraceae bacterium]